jgi:hypothetical protein
MDVNRFSSAQGSAAEPPSTNNVNSELAWSTVFLDPQEGSMISPNALAGVWLLTLAVVSALRTKNLPRVLVDDIDIVSLLLVVMATTSASMAVWRWFGPVPEGLLSWGMAAFCVYALLSQIIGIRLTRIAQDCP